MHIGLLAQGGREQPAENASSSCAMQVWFEAKSKEATLEFSVAPEETVFDVKERLGILLKVTPEELRLLYDLSEMKNEFTLCGYGVMENSVVEVDVVRDKGKENKEKDRDDRARPHTEQHREDVGKPDTQKDTEDKGPPVTEKAFEHIRRNKGKPKEHLARHKQDAKQGLWSKETHLARKKKYERPGHQTDAFAYPKNVGKLRAYPKNASPCFTEELHEQKFGITEAEWADLAEVVVKAKEK